jgi:hypothetical protein
MVLGKPGAHAGKRSLAPRFADRIFGERVSGTTHPPEAENLTAMLTEVEGEASRGLVETEQCDRLICQRITLHRAVHLMITWQRLSATVLCATIKLRGDSKGQGIDGASRCEKL